MLDLEDRLKELGDTAARQAPSELRPTQRALRRIRVGRAVRSGGVLVTVAALVVGGFTGARSLSRNDAAPIRPADETENKGAGALTYSFPDVEVSLHVAGPWAEHSALDEPTVASRIAKEFSGAWVGRKALVFDRNFAERLELDGDPMSVSRSACQGSLDSADPEALAREIRAHPDLAATAPVRVSVGGVDALQLDVTAVPGASPCSKWGPAYPRAPMVLAQHADMPGAALEKGSRMRLYLLDTPWRGENWSRRVFALWIVAPEARFEHVVEAAQPILDSIEFHAA